MACLLFGPMESFLVFGKGTWSKASSLACWMTHDKKKGGGRGGMGTRRDMAHQFLLERRGKVSVVLGGARRQTASNHTSCHGIGVFLCQTSLGRVC
mgnify:CR=1 FL=1